jgi:predicted dehydrogenase
MTTDHIELLKRDDVDAVYIATSWETHIEVAIDALKAGKAVALEVGGAYTVDECYDLVRTYEETGTPFMFMENCCYNKQELLVTAMARAGKFGRVVHCSGAYGHDLREEISCGNINRHYRLNNYKNRNCENYPTHELGPIAKLLNINRGNRMVALSSMASLSAGLEEYIKDNKLYEKDPTLKDAKFNQGDIVTTIIRCENGETITLTLDTTLPRSYSREFTVKGTKGRYDMNTNSVFLDGEKEYWNPTKYCDQYMNNAEKYESEFLPDAWKNMSEIGKKYGHGGMDGIIFSEFLTALTEGKDMPLDVYDAAAWMVITALSEISIANSGALVEIPDFTNGAYKNRQPTRVFHLS